ncbi:MAG: HEAT repeat domain-containing protein, partial [Deinococcales bacterium]|nr:HEAT repeat domain-containing protein [Chitinophagaceae bacterium]
LDANFLTIIEKMAKQDANRLVRATAIDVLSKTNDKKYLPLYLQSVKDSSYSVAGAALLAIIGLDEDKAMRLVPALKNDAKGRLKDALMLTKGDADFEEMHTNYTNVSNLGEKFNASFGYINFLAKVTTTANFKKGFDEVITFREKVATYGVAPQINAAIQEMAKKKEALKAKSQDAAAIDVQLAYIKDKM